ncbi:hypothetical protein PPN31119_00021 [Pandoraea pnomenusa]|uniref:Uncharacterized protein n=1 Tax=Pandoraea pnomenusa TaxID=93220 RepID=A0ABY6WDL8_9BURK|nr:MULTISPECIES: hypothetical protein [Pandoraea]AHB78570.1 hypothetical protein X636_14815 [Pandoraea pnomenusa]VVE59778.1 hypothetical protein PPN31119_00021 [Pandoraea pnomenusa]
MRLPFALASLDWIAPCDIQGSRIVLELDGQRGWTCAAGDGYCVATNVTPAAAVETPGRPPLASAFRDDAALAHWLARLTLALAAEPALRDDSLCLATDALWWVHRFDNSAPAAQVEAHLRRQLLACAMAVAWDADTTPRPGRPSTSTPRDGIAAADFRRRPPRHR